MITFLKLERKGNLGNQLFQIASTIGIAAINNHLYSFPEWSFSRYFKNPLPILLNSNYKNCFEKQFHYQPLVLDKESYNLEGWFQSEKYFDIAKTRHHFEFDPDFIKRLISQYSYIFEKKTILVSIRRGDFVDHPDYFQLPINYYINAIIDNFSDWRSRNLLILSDDIAYCKFHFSVLKNAYFADSLPAIDQLALGSLCDDFVISNSTFSWWCAWLGEKPKSVVVRPVHNFSERKNLSDNDRDYFPERWRMYNHYGKRIDLGEWTILLNRKNQMLQDYYENYFVNKVSFLPNAPSGSKLLISNFILPPLALQDAVDIAQETKLPTQYFLTGLLTKISPKHDFYVLRRQFDFGIFAKLFSASTSTQKSKIQLLLTQPENVADTKSINTKFVQAGMIARCAYRYRLYIYKKSLSKILKSWIKKLLGKK